MDYTKHRKFMAWTFMGNPRMYQVLNDYGHKIDTIGIFTFEVNIRGEINETGTDVASLMPYVYKWQHINWLLTIMNHGYGPIFQALMDNTAGAQDTFIAEIHRILNKYPWCTGVDIDLERGGSTANTPKANALFKRIYEEVKSRSKNRHVHVDLPAMAAYGTSVGGEYWADYATLDKYLDTATIMSYGMSWAGSSPGAVSPTWWIDETFNYAKRVMTPGKLFMGVPGYAFNWKIHATPADRGVNYRGDGFTYYGALGWLEGNYIFEESPTQEYIPFAGFFDWKDMSPYAMLHVYDYMQAWDTTAPIKQPMVRESYEGQPLVTVYEKAAQNKSTGIIATIDGTPSEHSGAVNIGEGFASLRTPGEQELPGKLTYKITVPTAGTYDLLTRINYPWFNQNSITIKIGSTTAIVGENRLFSPYLRKVHYRETISGHYFTAGQHTITVEAGEPGVQIWGFQIAQNGVVEATAGEAEYSVKPQQFKNVDGVMVEPDEYTITVEQLRRVPESALIWYEDWRDYGKTYGGALSNRYTINSGSWDVWWDKNSTARRPYSYLQGSGDVSLDYNSFGDLHVAATIAPAPNFFGKAGVYVGDLYLAINYPDQRLELIKGSTVLQSIAYESTINSFRKIAMRIRGNNVRVYTGTNETLRFEVNTTGAGAVGIKSTGGKVYCELLRIGDAWWYTPNEKFSLQLPNGTIEEFGRIPRTNIQWDTEFDYFKVTQDIEETETRSERVSLDFDFSHSSRMNYLNTGTEYPIKIIGDDIGVWVSKIYLGDSEGFSIMYYSDVHTIVHLANKAAYDFEIRGIGLWTLGQEDLRIWEYMPEIVPNPYE